MFLFLVAASRNKATACNPEPALVEVFVNDKPVQVPPGTTVLQVGSFDTDEGNITTLTSE
jgi:hypothetical protein